MTLNCSVSLKLRYDYLSELPSYASLCWMMTVEQRNCSKIVARLAERVTRRMEHGIITIIGVKLYLGLLFITIIPTTWSPFLDCVSSRVTVHIAMCHRNYQADSPSNVHWKRKRERERESRLIPSEFDGDF